MKERDKKIAKELGGKLRRYSDKQHPLLGIQNEPERQVFVGQLIDSIRRVKYVSVIKNRNISPERANPSSNLFDPIKAAILHQRHNQIEEAFWFVFLFVHFGKNSTTGYRLARDIYGKLGRADPWTWDRVRANPKNFRSWLKKNRNVLRGGDGVPRHFGNHRKYEGLGDENGTGIAVESYVNWIDSVGSHQSLVSQALAANAYEPRRTFDALYHSMNKVKRFGRMAKFDYLTMIGKLGLAPIEAGSTYMQGATGPVPGARLLLGGSTDAQISRTELDNKLIDLGFALNIGMQEIEDSLCNWQKSPKEFKRFRG